MAGVNELLRLSKIAKRDKNYVLERQCLEKALEINQDNIKVLNALERNLRRTGTQEEIEKCLERILEINVNGIVLDKLIRLVRSRNDVARERELLRMRRKLEPKNKRVIRRLEELGDRSASIGEMTQARVAKKAYVLNLTEESFQDIQEARKLIYGEEALDKKIELIKEVLVGQSEEVLLAILAELYKREAYNEMAKRLIKSYMKKIEEENNPDKKKLANKLYQLVTNKRIMIGAWEEFWKENRQPVDNNGNAKKKVIKKE